MIATRSKNYRHSWYQWRIEGEVAAASDIINRSNGLITYRTSVLMERCSHKIELVRIRLTKFVNLVIFDQVLRIWYKVHEFLRVQVQVCELGQI